jgi:hypothetical protein
MEAPAHPTGYDRLYNPRLNKGTAFTEAERRRPLFGRHRQGARRPMQTAPII